MSSADFAADLRQSVQERIALLHNAAAAAKARIGETRAPHGAVSRAPEPAFGGDAFDDDAFSANAFSDAPYEPAEPRPAVDFSMDEPEMLEAPAPEHPAEPDHAIGFDDFGGAVDDEGIPVWEDPP